jgi:hydroxymethylbilane synthase
VLNHEPTRRAVDAERAMLHALGGGCSVPVGALAHVDAADIHLASGAFSLAANPAVRAKQVGRDPIEVGKRAADDLVSRGANAILAEFHKQAQSPNFAAEAP